MLFRQAAARQELESKRGREAGPRSDQRKGRMWKTPFCSLNPHMPHPTRVQFSLVHHLNHT